MNIKKRKLEMVNAPQLQPGFLGKGHLARPVITVDFSRSDPFIMLMDDRLDKTDYQPVGGPHPHAGFETVTLVLAGEIGGGSHAMKAGDFELMTAGSGIIHTEIIAKPTKMRVLQLWLNLPRKDRQALPRVQRLPADRTPRITSAGVTIKVYSGTFHEVSSPVVNHTPLLVAEIIMEPNTSAVATIPADFNTFLYMLHGSVKVGPDSRTLSVDQVGWLDRSDTPGKSELKITSNQDGAHLVLYAAPPQHHEIVAHGPFIADSMDEIRQLYSDYRAGRMKHITEVSAERQLSY
jgi:quercetin 2,3-dioxygenase